jgi:hypothetical protein
MILSLEHFEKVRQYEMMPVFNYEQRSALRVQVEEETGLCLNPITIDRIMEAGEGGDFKVPTPEELKNFSPFLVKIHQLAKLYPKN